jgi:hypothetical protein
LVRVVQTVADALDFSPSCSRSAVNNAGHQMATPPTRSRAAS